MSCKRKEETESGCYVERMQIHPETGMDRLQGDANVKDTGSNRLLVKSGFRLEGTVRHGRMVSEYCDYNIWDLITEDIAGISESDP